MPQARAAKVSMPDVQAVANANAKKVGPMDPAHRMDWAILDLGYPPVSKRTVHIADLDAHVWGLDLIEGGELPVAMIVSARVVRCGRAVE